MFSQGNTSLSLEELQAKISDADLVSSYLGITKIPCLINSPFRKDTKPSLGLYSRDGKRIYWTDFATKEKGSVIDLLCKLWKCSFKDTINKISKDIVKPEPISFKATSKKVSISNSDSSLECRVREWRDYDVKYWESYGVPIRWLKYADVYPISHKIIIKDGKRYVFGADKYAYAFVEKKEGNITLKIYQPFNKDGYKWSNKHDRSVISLWTKIPEKGEKIVICSSLKDALCLWANTGIPAIAVQGEGYGISNTAKEILKSRFKYVYILFDNDKAGIIDGKKLSESTGFINVVLPQFNGGKDLSDYFKVNGKESFIQMINSLLNNEKQSLKEKSDESISPKNLIINY